MPGRQSGSSGMKSRTQTCLGVSKVGGVWLVAFVLASPMRNTTLYVGILLLPCGAPKDRDGGICESPLPYPLDSNPSNPGGIAAAGYYCCRGFGAILFAEFRCGSLISSSEFGAAVCVRAGIARISEDFVGFWSLVFHYWWDGLLVPAAIVRFAVVFRRICANRGWVGCFG